MRFKQNQGLANFANGANFRVTPELPGNIWKIPGENLGKMFSACSKPERA
jgi:hypothetical protein